MSVAKDLDEAKRLIQAGRLDEASKLCRRLVDGDECDEALYLLAVITGESGMYAESQTFFEQAVAKLPERADIAYNFGVILNAMGKRGPAMEQWSRTVGLVPNHADALFNLGRGHADDGALDDAAICLERVLALRPDDPKSLLNLGNVRYRGRRWEEAREVFERLVNGHPEHVQGWINLGLTELRDGRPEPAVQRLQKAVGIDPDNVLAHVNLAFALLRAGDMEAGFAEHEWRRLVQELRFPVTSEQPWNGEDPAGRRILLYAEQGQGDAIHFLRYVPVVADAGAFVRVYCHPSLVDVAGWVDGVDGVAGFGEPPPEFDLYAPLMSLPHLLGMTEIESAPPGPYVEPPPDVGLALDGPTPRVGIVWAGNPEHENDADRSCPLHELGPLFEAGHAAFYSLQVGEAAAAIADCGFEDRLTDLGRDFRSFADTAAAIRAMDLVIGVDTAAAHLAGAMGKPTWLMLPRVPDWRWPFDGADTPLYPSVRLYRKRDDEDWAPVVEDLKVALGRLGGGP